MGNRRLSLLLTCLVLAAPAAHAQTARSGGAPNAQLMAQLQQLASERTSLQAENAKMKKQVDDLQKELDALKKSSKALDEKAKSAAQIVARSAAEKESSATELRQTKDKMQELIAKFRETIATLKTMESQLTASKQALDAKTVEYKECRDRNAALYELNREVVTRLEQSSSWSRVARLEPFTKLKRVQLENLADDYKARAEDQRMAPAAGGPPAGSGAAQPSAPTTGDSPRS